MKPALRKDVPPVPKCFDYIPESMTESERGSGPMAYSYTCTYKLRNGGEIFYDHSMGSPCKWMEKKS